MSRPFAVPATRRTGRRLAGLGAAVGLAVTAALLAPVAGAASAGTGTADGATPAPAAPGPAPDGSETVATAAELQDLGAIGPGVLVVTPVGVDALELCTANFLYTGTARSDGRVDDGGDGAGAEVADPAAPVYLGTAAHCSAASNRSSVDGCTEQVLPLGTEIAIRGRDGVAYGGTLAYNSWAEMQARGETDPRVCQYNDFALIELDAAAAAVADPTVPGFGGPTGLATGGTSGGEPVYSYQPNQLTETPYKEGVSFGRTEGPFSHVVATVPPGVPGDSGAGYLDADGRAFGVLSSLMLPTNTNGVADIATALRYAAESDAVGDVELVPGTAPFTPGAQPRTEAPRDPATSAPLPTMTPSPLR
ncbi:serine protease [Pseudonocardia nematodicida]|uniref:Serine protease n=1 Tax=Pseudonocardia nematodicida TaxID=1206997 RepID=A0ABV1K8I3_9PSEU